MTQFREAGLETPDLDARLLVMAATGFTHTDMIARGTEFPSAETFEIISDYAQRRLAGEPVDNILGVREFYGRDFKISKDVLSPRPETEMLIDAALDILQDKSKARILDLGTGSGAIIITILAEAPHVKGVAIDVSDEALSITRQNANSHEVENRLTVLRGNWFDPVEGRFDIILSNPPYITDAAMDELAAEVSGFDPDLSLRGGEDGLIAYRDIISKASHYLKADGIVFFEIGYDQGKSVSDLLKQQGFTDISLSKDLSGHNRMIKARFKG